MLPRSGGWFTSGSLSLVHLLGRDGRNALSGLEGSCVREVHCYHAQDLTAKSLSLTYIELAIYYVEIMCFTGK